jgi:hypothetical protein
MSKDMKSKTNKIFSFYFTENALDSYDKDKSEYYTNSSHVEGVTVTQPV